MQGIESTSNSSNIFDAMNRMLEFDDEEPLSVDYNKEIKLDRDVECTLNKDSNSPISETISCFNPPKYSQKFATKALSVNLEDNFFANSSCCTEEEPKMHDKHYAPKFLISGRIRKYLEGIPEANNIYIESKVRRLNMPPLLVYLMSRSQSKGTLLEYSTDKISSKLKMRNSESKNNQSSQNGFMFVDPTHFSWNLEKPKKSLANSDALSSPTLKSVSNKIQNKKVGEPSNSNISNTVINPEDYNGDSSSFIIRDKQINYDSSLKHPEIEPIIKEYLKIRSCTLFPGSETTCYIKYGLNLKGILLGDLLRLLYFTPDALKKPYRVLGNLRLLQLKNLELLHGLKIYPISLSKLSPCLKKKVELYGLLIFCGRGSVHMKNLFSNFDSYLKIRNDIEIAHSEIDNILFEMLPDPKVIFETINEESKIIQSYIPKCLVEYFGEDIGTGFGVACYLFCIIFTRLFIDEKHKQCDFLELSCYIKNFHGKEGIRIQDRISLCYSSLTKLYNIFHETHVDMLSACGALQARYRTEIAPDIFKHTPANQVQLDRQRAKLFPSYHAARQKIHSVLINNLMPIFINLNKTIQEFYTFLQFLSKESSVFGAFNDQAEYFEFTKLFCKPGMSPLQQITYDIEQLKVKHSDNLNFSNTLPPNVKVALRTCTTLAAFFLPNNFRKCLNLLAYQTNRVLEHFVNTKKILFYYWASRFSETISADVCYSAAKALPEVLTCLQTSLDRIEIWFRSVNENVLRYYYIQMIQGLGLYMKFNDLESLKTSLIPELQVPAGSKNIQSLPPHVSYETTCFPMPPNLNKKESADLEIHNLKINRKRSFVSDSSECTTSYDQSEEEISRPASQDISDDSILEITPNISFLATTNEPNDIIFTVSETIFHTDEPTLEKSPNESAKILKDSTSYENSAVPLKNKSPWLDT